MNMMRRLVACSLAGALASAAELPVRKVVLYKHGIGFFERAGKVAAGETARLDFKAGEMNDVLKSLTIQERGGGRVAAVRYDSSEPLDRKLREFPFAIGKAQPLPAILDQLKGARVEMRFGNDRVEGTIVSARATAATERAAEKHEVILLLDSGDVRAVDLGAAAGLRFPDPRVQEQFREYLAALSQGRNRERRGVLIESSAAGARDLVANYVIPMPAWKSSYRLVMDGGPEPLLEGWAIVDNTTGEDWSGVTLALVSGLPVSFVSRLYEPRYVARPEAELADDRAQRPVVHAGAMQAFRDERGQEGAKAMAAPAPAAPPRAFAMAEAAAREERSDFSSSLAATAAGRELGDLFEYRIPHVVTIRKNESAMIPFLQQRVKGRKLLVFSEAHGSAHPLAAVEIQNSSGKTLDGGAVTVIDAAAYAGEALMETLKAGDKRLVSYAVDLGTRITTAFDSTSSLQRELRFRRGILTTRTAVREVKMFTIRNVDNRAKTVLVETPVRPEYKLVGAAPAETTVNTRRFEVAVAAGGTEKFPVTEERILENRIEVANLTPDVLFSYVSNPNLEEAARKKLEPLAQLKRQLAVVRADAQRVEKQIQELFQDQTRLRQNISSLNAVSGQQQRVQEYAQRLAAQETELAGLRDRKSELERKQAALEQQVNDMVETLVI
jgi:hypothetical protein